MYMRIFLAFCSVFLLFYCSSSKQENAKVFDLKPVQVIKKPIYWLLIIQANQQDEFFINGKSIPLAEGPCKETLPCKASFPGNAWLRPFDNKLSIKRKGNTTDSAENSLFALVESQMEEGKVFPKWKFNSADKKLKIESEEPKLLAMLVMDKSNEVNQDIDLTVGPSQIVTLGPQHSQLDFKTKGSVGELHLNGVPIYSSKEFFNMDFSKTLKKNDPESRVVKELLEKGFGQTIFEPWTKFLIQGKNQLVYRPKSLPVEFKDASVQLSIRFDPTPLSQIVGPGFVGRNLFKVDYSKQQLSQSELVFEFTIPKYVQRPWELGKTIDITSSIQDQIKIRIREAQHVLRQGNKSELQQLFRTYLQYQERIYGDDIGKKVVEYWAELAKSPGFDFYEQGMDNLSFALYFDDRLLRVKRNDLPALLGYNDVHEQILFPSYFILRESGLEFALD